MGQKNTFLTVFSVCILFVFVGLSFPRLIAPIANAAPAQIHPTISVSAKTARDANTFQSDKALDAACRASGQESAVCLCVTHIMKYELSLASYRAAATLYGQTDKRMSLRQDLLENGYHTPEIDLAEKMEFSLIKDKDFAPRCANAKAYYRSSSK